MKKLLLAALFVALLLALGTVFVRQLPAPSTAAPEAAPAEFALKLSRRLGDATAKQPDMPPAPATRGAAPPAPPANARILLAILAAAAVLGLLFGALLRSPRAAPQPLTADPAPAAEPETPRSAGGADVVMLRDDRDALTKELQHTQHKLADANGTLEELHAQLEAERAQSEELASSLRTQLDEAHEHDAQHSGEARTLTDELNTQRIALKEREDALAQWEAKSAQWDLERASGDGERAQIETALAAAGTELADAQARVRTLESDLSDSLEALDETEQSLREHIEENARLRADFEDRVAQIEALDAQLLERNTSLQEQAATLDEREQTLRKQTGDIDALRHELDEGRARVDALDSDLRERSAALEQHSATVSEQEQALSVSAARAGELEDELQQQAERVETLSGKLLARDRTVCEQAEAIADYTSKLDEQTRRLDEVSAALAQQSERADALDAALAERDEIVHEQARAAAQAQEQIDELSGIRAKLESWHSTVATLERETRERDIQIVQLRADTQTLASLESHSSELKVELATTRAQWQEQVQLDAELKQKLDEREARLDTRKRELADAREREALLEEDLAASDARGVELRERVEALEAALAEVEAQRDTLASDLQNLIEVGHRDARTIATLESDLESWQDRLVDRESELHDEKRVSDDLRDRMTTLEMQQSELADQKHDVETQLAASGEELRDRQSAIERLQIELADGENEIAALNEQILGIIEAKTKLSEWDSTISTYRNEIRDKTRRLDELAEQHERAQAELEDLGGAREDVARLEQQLAEKVALTRVLKDGADAMRAHKDTAQRRKLEIAQLEQELSHTQRTADDAEQALRNEQRETATLRSAVDEHEQRVDTLQEELETERRTGQELDAQLSSVRSDYADLSRQADDYRAALAAVSNDLQGFVEHNAEVRDMLSAEIEPLPEATPQVDLDAARTDTVEAIGALRARADEHDATRARLSEVDEQLDSERRLSASLREEVDVLAPLRDQFAHNEEALRRQERDADEMRATLAQTEAALEDLERQRDAAEELATQLDALQTTNASLTAQIEVLVADKQALTAELDGFTGHIDTLRDELTSAAQSSSAAHAALDEIKSEREALVEQLSAVGEEKEALSQALALDRDENSQLYDEIERLEADIRALQEAAKKAAEHEQSISQQLREFEERETEATREISQLRIASEQTQQLKVDVDALTHKVHEDESILEAVLERVGELTERDVTIDNWGEAINALFRDIDDHKSRIDAARQESVALREELARVREADTYEISGLRAQVEHLEQQQSENDGIARERDKLRKAMDLQLDRTRKLARALVQHKEKLKQLQGAAKKLPERVPVLRDPLKAPPVLTRAVAVGNPDDETG